MGFLEWLQSLFVSDDPERKKQKLLRDIATELKRGRPRFYNPALRTAEPALARFFYEIYRAVAAGQALLKGSETSAALKSAVIELSLNEEQAAIKSQLSAQLIDERAKKGADPAALSAEIKGNLKRLLDSFDADWINEIDALYNRLHVLLDLVSFDYYFLLRKFDSAIPERDFAYKPRFEPVEISNILESLQDFMEILPGIDADADWDHALEILREHRSVEVIPHDPLYKALHLIKEVQRSGVIPMIVCHAVQNPGWKPMTKGHRDRVVEPYISKLKAEAETAAQKAAQGKRNEQIGELVRQVFGTGAVARLSNYSEQANGEFAQKMLGGFLHVTALNYLRAFLIDYIPKSIRDVVDLLLIKGKWGNSQASQQMSEAFHQLLKVSETIQRFDEDLAENGELGRRLKTIAMRAERDRKAHVLLRTSLQQINDEAHTMINDAVGHLVSIARVLKMAYEDCGQQNPTLIINWKELKPVGTDKDIKNLIAVIYRKIYAFVQLMQFYK